MIPQFPAFKKLAISDKTDIEQITRNFPPYAEFNVGRMWIWNTVAGTEISLLHENLIIQSTFFQSKYSCFSVVGVRDVDQTLTTLIHHAKQVGIDTTLQSIPEYVIEQIKNPTIYTIAEDRDKFEYILSSEEIVELQGSKFREVRQKINKFHRDYGERITFAELPITDMVRQSILDLYTTWRKRGKTQKETEGGLRTLHRALDYAEALNFTLFGLSLDEKLIGYAFVERSFGNCLIRQISVADAAYRGASQYLGQQVIMYGHTLGYTKVNIMEDDGIPGLRESKEQWRPTHFLKKYTVQLTNSDINS